MSAKYKYLKVKEKILADAESLNSFRLPSERELCKQHKISRNTAKKALNSLYEEKLVTRKVGRGTFLIPSRRITRVSFIQAGIGGNLLRFFEEEARLFSKENPNIEVLIHNVNPGEIIRAARNLPGSKVLFAPNVGYLIQLGLLEELDSMSMFQEATRGIQSQYLDWAKLGKDKPHCYSLPVALNSSMCAINLTHAQTLGLDTENGPQSMSDLFDWLKTADAHNRKKRSPQIFGTHLHKPDSSSLHSPAFSFYLTLSSGKLFLEEKDGQVVFDFSHGKEWIEIFRRIRLSGSILIPKTLHPNPIVSGETLFNYDIGSWAPKELEDAGKISDVKICPFPPLEKKGATFAQASKVSLAIIKDAHPDHPSTKAAWSFIRHLTCKAEPQRRMAEKMSFLSVNKSVFAEQAKQANLQPFIQALATGTMRSDHPIQHSIMKIVRKYFFDAVYDLIPANEAVSRIEEMCKLQIEMGQEVYQDFFFNR